MEQNIQAKKAHIPAEQFNKNSCKLNINKENGRLYETIYHEELLDKDQMPKCSPDQCETCTCVLC